MAKKILIKYGFLFVIASFFFVFCYISNGITKNKIKLYYRGIVEKQNLKILNLMLSNFVSYTQDFEDFILFYLFYDVENGFYIDVGANDPNLMSVTKAFYDRGWHGINIEPLPFKYSLLKKFRHRDINIQLGAGKKKKLDKLSITCPNGECSSIVYSKKFNISNTINIQIETMANICKKYIPLGIEIQFCKIDVERAEKDVLMGFDFRNYRPKVFCIESLINEKTQEPLYKEWEYILKNNNYNFGYAYRRNRFYYDNRINFMKEKFKKINYYVNIYKKKLFKIK